MPRFLRPCLCLRACSRISMVSIVTTRSSMTRCSQSRETQMSSLWNSTGRRWNRCKNRVYRSTQLKLRKPSWKFSDNTQMSRQMENLPHLLVQITHLLMTISSLKRSQKWYPSWKIPKLRKLSDERRLRKRQKFLKDPLQLHLWKRDQLRLVQEDKKTTKVRLICLRHATSNPIRSKVIYQVDAQSRALLMAETLMVATPHAKAIRPELKLPRIVMQSQKKM